MEPTATATGEAQITPMPGGTSDTRQTEEQRGQAIETATNEIVALGQQHNMADIARNFVAGEMARGAIPSLPTFRGVCLLYTSPSPRDQRGSRMPSSA